MDHFTAFDLQRHVGKVQDAAMAAPVAITHHGQPRLVLMDYDRWRRLGRGDCLADAIRRLQAERDRLREEGIATISVFGSVARGEAGPDSDIDLLIEPLDGVPVGGLRLARWKTLMGDLLGREADVVIPEFLSDAVRATMQVDRIEAVSTRRAAPDAL